ncbi:hypothetical protein Rsub_12515 [Raphidocelis subcapitata]|uniref:Uncharacterized protein n=1 Tax=Raphidocelis subcapitata TaxID=307507 RepID=A0A2V0PP15_9CHLO|nr:hypothetical protein Rsub_12515 [Raphidocelis subcapitata]|eukprot:GBF99740.1 hypothetical protein Rsub_12515 [Raphidocelis subcapitata]
MEEGAEAQAERGPLQQAQALADMFLQSERSVPRNRAGNLFEQLSQRSLTREEQDIIAQRVEAQRRLLQEYERRERERKVREVRDTAPELSERAALRALELCGGREEDAILRLSAEPALKRRCMADAGDTAVPRAAPLPAGAEAPVLPKSKLINPAKLDGIYCGRFRSKMGPYQLPGKPSAGVDVCSGSVEATPAPAEQPAGAAVQQLPQDGRKRSRSASLDGDCEGGCGTAGTGQQTEEQQQQQQQQQQQGSLAPLECLRPAGPGGDVEMMEAMGAGASEPVAELADGAEETAGEAAAVAEPSAGGDVAPAAPATTPPKLEQQQQQPQQEEGPPLRPRAAASLARQIARLDLVLQLERLSELAAAHLAAPDQLLRCLRDDLGQEQLAAALETAWEVQQAAILADAHEAAQRGQGSNAAAQARPRPLQSPRQARRVVAAPPLPPQQQQQQQQQQQRQQQQQPAAEAAPELGLLALLREGFSQAPQLPAEAPGPSSPDAGPSHEQQAQQRVRDRLAAGPPSTSDPDEPWLGSSVPRRKRSKRALRPRFGAGGSGVGAGAGGGDSSISGGGGSTSKVGAPAGKQPSPRRSHGRMPGGPAAVVAAGAAAASAPAGVDESGAAATAAAAVEAPAGPDTTVAVAAAAAAAAAAAPGPSGGVVLVTSRGSGGGAGGGSRAVNPVTGHTCRGRVRQKSHKNTELVELGTPMVGKGWYNAGYIFPAGFKSRLLFRSSIDLDALTLHECGIVGEGGAFWPAPTFVVTARDRPDEPMVARSCTGCWSGILKRIKGVIETRRAAGEALPPAPKTAIAGPEYFGLNDAGVVAAIEALDPGHLCEEYWAGKRQRDAAIASAGAGAAPGGAAAPAAAAGAEGAEAQAIQPAAAAAAAGAGGAAAPRGAAGGGAKRKAKGQEGRRGRGAGDDGEDDPEAAFRSNHWSMLSRAQRYRARAAAAAGGADDADGGAGAAPPADEDNPLPHAIDPVTLEPVVAPAISPYGHVMGLATWRAVLAEDRRCPFTKRPLKPEQLVALNHNNIERYRDILVLSA